MACNCATSEQLKELYETYGEKVDAKLNGSALERIKNYVRKFLVFLCLIPITPVIIVYVLYKAFGDDDKRISIRKLFRLEQN